MASLGDDWEVLQDSHHDVLSCSDTETSEGESESRAAGAIIEALEEAPPANLQGMALGSLPHFLGGWYSSSPPAAGRTFSVDLSPVSTPDPTHPSQPGSPVAAAETVVSEDYEDPLDDLPAAQPAEEQGDAEAVAAPVAPPGSNHSTAETATAVEATAATASSTPGCQVSHATRYCLLSAAALATLLLLLACSSGSPSPTMGTSAEAMAAVPAWHTTSTDHSYRRFGSSSSNRHHATASWALQAAPLAAPPPSAGGSSSAAGRDPQPVVALPWWLRDEAGAALRRGGSPSGLSRSLPQLPHGLQLIAEGSIHANMTAGQRLRLHLWLLHCAARNSSTTPSLGRGQAAIYPLAFTPYTPLELLAAPARPHLAQPSPGMHQCRSSAAAQQWVAPTKPAGHWALCPAAPATPMLLSTAPHGVSGKETACPATAAQPAVAPPPAPTPLAAAPRATPWGCALGHAPAAPYRATPAAPTTAAAPATTAAAAAAGAGGTARGPDHPKARQVAPITVQPTRPVPPLYRPPLPCLLLGGRRPNSTAVSSFRGHAPAHQHSPSAPAARTKAWPNATAWHQQFFGSAGSRARVGGRYSRPYGRALAMGMARWGWHQPAGRVGVCGPPPSLPMLQPVSQKEVAGSSSGSSPSSGSIRESRGSSSGSSWAGLSLPMLPPVACTAADKQQQEQQPGKSTLPMLPPVTPGGLTLPMLPPVSEGRVGQEGSRAAAKTDRAPSGAVASTPQQARYTAGGSNTAVQEEGEAAGAWQQLLDSMQHRPSTETSVSTCATGSRQSHHGLLLVHTLQAPSVAAAAAAGAARFAQPQQQQQHRCAEPYRGACVMQCGGVCGDAETCGSVCVERCPGMAPLYMAIPATSSAPSQTNQASLAIPLPPAEPLAAVASAAAGSQPLSALPVPVLGAPGASFTPAAAAPIPLPAAQGPSTPLRNPSAAPAASCLAVATAAALAAPPAWALLVPAGSRSCSNNGTRLLAMLGAAAKLAAAAADLATAAADLATAAATLQSAPPPGKASCLPPAFRALMGREGQHSGSLYVAPSARNGTRAPSAVEEAGEAGTRWVASLVTLPMLPPSREEGQARTYADGAERDAESSEGANPAAGRSSSSSRIVTPFGLSVSCNMSEEASHDDSASADKPRQPLWLVPVM